MQLKIKIDVQIVGNFDPETLHIEELTIGTGYSLASRLTTSVS